MVKQTGKLFGAGDYSVHKHTFISVSSIYDLETLQSIMSWQTYVDTNLVGSGKVAKAAILGQAGGVWATSPGFELSAAEQKAAIGLLNNKEAAQASGITLAGTKYFALQVDERKFYGKKAADGCVIVKTKQAILVTAHSAPIQLAESATTVETLADYLISVGY